MMRRSIIVGAVAALGVFTATFVFTRPHRQTSAPHEELAVLISHADTTALQIPDTVRVGKPFEVAFTTFGGGCVRRGGTTTLIASYASVIVQAYDRDSGDPSCPMDRLAFTHTARVRFVAPGVASIRVIGRASGGISLRSRLVELRRQVIVR